jgi:hypothetical protein
MDILQEARETSRQTFFNHVFSTTDDGKAELLNIIQYASLGLVPVVILNKSIQRFIPEADIEKPTIELLLEIFVQITVMFCGIMIIHRMITYVPTYSGFKYDSINLSNVILSFLVLILSIQSKLGLKTNIIYERVLELWNGPNDDEHHKKKLRRKARVNDVIINQNQHIPSQADDLDEPPHKNLLLHPESSTARGTVKPPPSPSPPQDDYVGFSPQPANGMIGGGFGSLF